MLPPAHEAKAVRCDVVHGFDLPREGMSAVPAARDEQETRWRIDERSRSGGKDLRRGGLTIHGAIAIDGKEVRHLSQHGFVDAGQLAQLVKRLEWSPTARVGVPSEQGGFKGVS